MINNKFKFSALTIALFSATGAHAALYQVVEVAPPASLTFGSDYTSAFGTAIEPSSGTNCFSSDCTTDTTTYSLAGETRRQKTMAGQPVDGIPYRDDAPFGMDNKFFYVDKNHTDDSSLLKRYCEDELQYQNSICEAWGDTLWTEWKRELDGGTTVNAYGFYQADGVSVTTLITGSNNTVVNAISSGVLPISGIEVAPGQKRVATSIQPITGSPSSVDGARAWVYQSNGSTNFYAGSVLETAESDGHGTFYTSQAALWTAAGTPINIGWGDNIDSANGKKNDRLAQGAIRDFTVIGPDLYGVGFNTYDNDNYLMSATIFKFNNSGPAPTYASSIKVPDVSVTSSDRKYSNTVLTAVNQHGVAIGEAKLKSAQNGSLANKLFVVPNVTAASPTVTFFSDGTGTGGEIGFGGAGGHANAINTHNDIVGQIDTEAVRESGGKPRRKRGFIYPYNDSTNGSLFDNKAWLLDDLTNGGSESASNNQYRILSANDINDAGVIAATAIKCEGGYASTAHDAFCAADNEKTVAVKLIPINGVSRSDIIKRGYNSSLESVSRSGAPIGVMTIFGLFGLVSLRKKK